MGERGGSVAVVGAGPAGLAAAWRLAERGVGVRVYEARPEAGGRLRTEVVAGLGADAAVQLLSSGYDRLLGLLADMGLSDRLVDVPGRDALWRRGAAHPIHYGSVTRMALSGAVPARLKLRLGLRYVPFLERHADALDLSNPAGGPAAGLNDESIAEWGRREMGDDFVELLAYPLLAAYYGVTPEETAAGFFHGLAHMGMRVTVLGARGGAGALAGAMADALRERGVELVFGRTVEGVTLDGDAVRIRSGGEPAEHDAVVVAVPRPTAARLVDPARVPDVRVRSTATLVLALREPLRTGWFGLSVPRTEPPGEHLAAVCVQSEKQTGVVAGAGGSLVVMPSPAEAERWADADPGEIAAGALPAVERLVPSLPDVVEARLVRLPDSVVVPAPSHFETLGRFRPDTLPPRLALAGDYLVSPTVEGAVRSGLAAGDRIASVLP